MPMEVINDNYKKMFDGRLHPRRPGHSVRREMTEQRISDNIKKFNSTVDRSDISDLFVGSIRDSSLIATGKLFDISNGSLKSFR